MKTYEVMNLIDEAGDLIAESQGMNITYCESMDMSLFPVVVTVIDDGYDEDDIREMDILNDLHFLAENNRFIPSEYEEADYQTIRAYLLEHQEEILEEIAEECRGYIDEYSDCEPDEEEEIDEYE